MYKCDECGIQVGQGIPSAVQRTENGQKRVCMNCYDYKAELTYRAKQSLPMLITSLVERQEELKSMSSSYDQNKVEKIRHKIENIKERIAKAKAISGIIEEPPKEVK